MSKTKSGVINININKIVTAWKKAEASELTGALVPATVAIEVVEALQKENKMLRDENPRITETEYDLLDWLESPTDEMIYAYHEAYSNEPTRRDLGASKVRAGFKAAIRQFKQENGL